MKDWFSNNKKRVIPLFGLVILIIALPLTLILVRQAQDLRSSAVSPDKLETEQGVFSGAVSKLSDSTASGGQYVKFAPSGTTPAPTTPDAASPTPDVAQPSVELEGLDMVFAMKYLITVGSSGEKELYLFVGYYSFGENGQVDSAKWYQYFANANTPFWTTSASHDPMNCPFYVSNGCTPGHIKVSAYSNSMGPYTGTYTLDPASGTLRVTIGSVYYKYELDDAATGAFSFQSVINRLDGTRTVGDVTFSHTYGWAYLTPDARTTASVSYGDFLPKYLGDSWTNGKYIDPDVGPTYPGDELTRQFNPRVFDISPADSDVWTYVNESNNTAGMCVQTSVLTNYAYYSKAMFYVNGGHDFDWDGCAATGDQNESGHMFTYLGVYEGGQIARFVGIEYSYQSDGFPIVGVYRFHAP